MKYPLQTLTFARQAAEIVAAVGCTKDKDFFGRDTSYPIPGWAELAGWRYLARGTTRVALIGPDGLVYKVGCCSKEANQREAATFTAWKLEGRPFVPEWAYFPGAGVLVMPQYTTLSEYARSHGFEGDWLHLGHARNFPPDINKQIQYALAFVRDFELFDSGITWDGRVVALDAGSP